MKKPDFRKYFLEVRENPGKIFGLVYVYILTIILVIGLYYVNNLNGITRQMIPPSPPDTLTIGDLPVVEAKTIPAVNLSSVQNPTPEDLEKGKQLYTTVCASCHGESGKGNGPAGAALNPKPRDFTSKEGWKNGFQLTGIYKTLDEGIPGSPMISYNYMPPGERISISNYIMKNFIPSAPAVTQDEVTLLDQTYNLSRGTDVAAQIPVGGAMKFYLAENRVKTDKLIGIMREISSSNTEGGVIFRRITSDRGKAITSLFSDSNWKQEKNKFISLVNTSVNRNGFNSQIFNLNEKDWDTLYNYLAGIF